jgi:hypothetical protein
LRNTKHLSHTSKAICSFIRKITTSNVQIFISLLFYVQIFRYNSCDQIEVWFIEMKMQMPMPKMIYSAKKCVNGRAKLDTRNTQFTHIQTISLKKHKNKLFASSWWSILIWMIFFNFFLTKSIWICWDLPYRNYNRWP